MTFASGNYYEGDWKFDKKHGYGEMHWLTTNELYRGYWEENMQDGFGVHLWLEEPGKLKSLRNRYEGMWFNGQRNGLGTFFYSDGSRYDGEWADNLKEGFAIFTDPSGDEMEAIFKNDRLFQRLNEPRKIKMTSLVPEASEDPEEDPQTKGNQKGKKGAKQPPAKGAPTTGAASTAKSPPRERGRSKKKEEGPPQPDKEQEFLKRNLENQVLNPYLQILRVDDLLATVASREEVRSSLEIALLHNNSLLMDIFKEYKAVRANINELSCTMTLRSLWKFLRDSRILSPALSLAVFDRHFYANPANKFPLFFNLEETRTRIKNLKLAHYSSNPRKLDMLKKLDVYLRNEDVRLTFKRLDYDRLDASLQAVDQHHWSQWEEDSLEKAVKQQMRDMRVRDFNLHDPDNIIQFRHFIDGLIRAVYVRENFSFQNIGEDIDKKYIKFRVEPIVYLKNHFLEKPFVAEEEDKVTRFLDNYQVEKLEPMKSLFRKHLSHRVQTPADVNQLTTDVASMRRLLKSAKLMNSQADELKFFKIVERYFDPDSSYIEIMQKKADLAKHFNRMQTLELNSSNNADSMDLDVSQAKNKQNGGPGDASPAKNSDHELSLDRLINNQLKPAKPPADLKLAKAKSPADINIENIEEESYNSEDAEHKKPGEEERAGSLDQDVPLSEKRAEVLQRNYETKESSDMLHKLLGHELLYFEFVENLALYLFVTVPRAHPGQAQADDRVPQSRPRGPPQSPPKRLQQALGCAESLARDRRRPQAAAGGQAGQDPARLRKAQGRAAGQVPSPHPDSPTSCGR